jgi:son of sevenless-like protein
MLMTIRSNGILPDETNTQRYNNYDTNANSFSQYADESPLRTSSPLRTQASNFSSSDTYQSAAGSSRLAPRRRSPPLMNGILGNAPQPVMYVRALYDYEADDRTSLSFHEGDEIQVITQLESGWWDGVINGVRGWFPSNYCQVITNPEPDVPKSNAEAADGPDAAAYLGSSDSPRDGDNAGYISDSDSNSEGDSLVQYPIQSSGRGRADFWLPQATPDGRLYYYNTETGESSMELPLESPSSATENGPRDRMNVNIPDKTRPPPEMMARGFVDNGDESDGNSASEIEGEALMLASTSSLVKFFSWCWSLDGSTNHATAPQTKIVRIRWCISRNFHGLNEWWHVANITIS